MECPGQVRLCFARCVSLRTRDELEAAMRAVGFSIAGSHELGPAVATVVVFEADLPEALALVRARARVQERVLVVTRVDRGGAVQLAAAGAADVFVCESLARAVACIAARLERWTAIDELLASDAVARAIVGTSPAWQRVLRQVVEVARFTDAPVLVTGETGTGKELISQLVHQLDARPAKRDLVVLDCTTVVPELSGSEFFGHEKGSFTGALAARTGAFALADEGTLFLDEIGELPLPLQAGLLRVVQERTYKRVGGSAWQSTSFRLVCATNRDLEREQEAGRFRPDLYYRLSGWTFHLPPLRERREDVLPLARHFLGGHELDDAVAQHLRQREYRGNIRELRQLCARIAHRHVGPGPITIGDLGHDLGGAAADERDWCDPAFRRAIEKALSLGVGLKDIGRIAEDVAVQMAVERADGSLQHAARRLGVTDRALQLRRASARAAEAAAPADQLEALV